MLKNIEAEFKKASAYYSYERAGIFFTIVGTISVLAAGILSVWAYMSYTPLMAQIGISVAILAIIISFPISEKFKPKEKEYYVWLKVFRFEKRNGYNKDKPKLREILTNNGVITVEKLREIVLFYRNKNQSVIINNGNFFAILAICLASVAFVFSVNDGFTDIRFILVTMFVVLPLEFYFVFLITKKRLNVYRDFYQILEKLLTEILIEDLGKVVEKPKKAARKTRPKKTNANANR